MFDVGAVTTYTTAAAPGVYFVRVSGANGCGLGTPSNEVSVVVGAPIPGPPTGLSAAISATRMVTLTWQAPTAGGTPTEYVVEAGSAPGQSNLAALPTGSMTSFSALVPPGRYYVRVRAINMYGTSAASEEIVLLVI